MIDEKTVKDYMFFMYRWRLAYNLICKIHKRCRVVFACLFINYLKYGASIITLNYSTHIIELHVYK